MSVKMGAFSMKLILFLITFVHLSVSFSKEKINFSSTYKKSLFRIDNLIPEIRKMKKDGRDVYKKAIKVVRKKGIIDADLYEKINLTTAKILAVQSELEEISNDMRDAEEKFVRLKNIPSLLEFMTLMTTYILMEENYRFTLKRINKYSRLRRMINRGDKVFKRGRGELNHYTKMYKKAKIKKKIKKASKIYNNAKKSLPFVFRYRDGKFLDKIISSSFKYKDGQISVDDSFYDEIKILSDEFKVRVVNSSDLTKEAGYNFFDKVSKALGNTVLGYQWREGVLKKNKKVVGHLKSILRPLDVANSKIRHKVSSYVIPGFWTHNALWIGTEADLKEIGIWNHPKMKPYQKKIRGGASFLEADKPGVRLATIPFFLRNLDDVSIMRHKDLFYKGKISKKDKAFLRERILIAIGHVGKQYDFNFDFDFGDKIICSDVIHFSFPNVKFDIKKRVGRFTTTPDVIAREAFEGKSFKVISLYIYGKRYPKEVGKDLTKVFTDLTENKIPLKN